MKRVTLTPALLLVLCALAPLQAAPASPAAASTVGPALPPARLIPLEGDVKEFLFDTVKRRTEEALRQGARCIVYRIKSDGGEVGAALDLSNYIFKLPADVRAIAYVDVKAYSAAALIALACDDLYMTPGSSIGDCEPITLGGEGPITIGEKIQSPLRERFRAFARENHYPELLAQAMVTKDLEVIEVLKRDDNSKILMLRGDYDDLDKKDRANYKKLRTVNHAGRLLTLGDDEALELGFSRGTFASSEELLRELGYQPQEVAISAVTRTDTVMDFFDDYAPIFLAAAVFFAYLEFKSPGVGLFAVLSLLSLVAFFVDKLYTGQANYLEVLIFLLGVALLAIEVFLIPGFGVTGILGLVLIFSSLVLAMQDFNLPQGQIQLDITLNNIKVLCGSILGATLLFCALLAVLSKTRLSFLPGLVHQVSAPPASGSELAPEERSWVGRRGVTLCALRPAGKADFSGTVLQVVAKDGWIDSSADVEVCEQEGARIAVRLRSPAPHPSSDPSPSSSTTT